MTGQKRAAIFSGLEISQTIRKKSQKSIWCGGERVSTPHSTHPSPRRPRPPTGATAAARGQIALRNKFLLRYDLRRTTEEPQPPHSLNPPPLPPPPSQSPDADGRTRTEVGFRRDTQRDIYG